MPGERRNLRSNKETSSSANGEKARSNSQSSSAKDKPVPTRSTSSKSKTATSTGKKATNSGKDGNSSKPRLNGTEPIENGVNGTDDIDMVDEGHEIVKANGEADEEMTVVVPPRNSKLLGEQDKESHDDTAMDHTDQVEGGEEDFLKVDPKIKAVSGTIYP